MILKRFNKVRQGAAKRCFNEYNVKSTSIKLTRRNLNMGVLIVLYLFTRVTTYTGWFIKGDQPLKISFCMQKIDATLYAILYAAPPSYYNTQAIK